MFHKKSFAIFLLFPFKFPLHNLLKFCINEYALYLRVICAFLGFFERSGGLGRSGKHRKVSRGWKNGGFQVVAALDLQVSAVGSIYIRRLSQGVPERRLLSVACSVPDATSVVKNGIDDVSVAGTKVFRM